MIKIESTAFLLSALLLSSPTLASKEQNYFDLSLNELLKIEVSGSTLKAETVRSTPSAVTVFTRTQIANMGFNTLDELLNLVPGFQSYRQGEHGNYNAMTSRGRRIGGSSIASLLILVDGHRIAEGGNDGSGNIMPRIPLYNIETVEFIRGANSAIYGSNAMMGVINIVTVTDENELNVSYGSFNRKVANLLLSKDWGRVGIDFYARLENLDGDEYSAALPLSAGRMDTDDPESNRDINLKLQYGDTRLSLIHTGREADNFYIRDSLSNEFNRADSRYDSLSLIHPIAWMDVKTKISLFANSTQFELNEYLLVPPLPHSSPPFTAYAGTVDSVFKSEEQRAKIDSDWSINNRSSLQFGIEYRVVKVTSATTAFNPVFPAFPPIIPEQAAELALVLPEKQKILGLYTQYQHAVTSNTHLTLGVRFDDYSLVKTNLSPKLGLIHHLTDVHTFKLIYGEAFRAPSLAELGLTNNIIIAGNLELKPETVETVELIWAAQWDNTALSVGYFENTFKDSIVFGPNPEPSNLPFQVYYNGDQSPSKGFELEALKDISENWQVRGTWSHLSDKPGESLREADNVGSLMLNYHLRNWNLNLISVYHDERQMVTATDGTTLTLDDYWLLNTKIKYNYKDSWVFSLSVNNLLGEDYQTPAQSTNLPEGIPNKSRDAQVNVTFIF